MRLINLVLRTSKKDSKPSSENIRRKQYYSLLITHYSLSMCGICGILDKSKRQNYDQAIEKMCDAIAHRGRDDSGIYTNENISLGHRRLAIIDLSQAGHQPMVSDCKRYVIVYNGEVYNFGEIRKKLTSYRFRGNTDTEVVLAAYKQWGKDCLTYFNGMFAFAVWDNVEKTLFIARDRFGIKPLYYHNGENTFVFSSEIRSILASEVVPAKINNLALVDYLRFQTVQFPDTIVENIRMLPPGYYATLKQGKFEQKLYWKNNVSPTLITDAGQAKKQLFRLLSQAVEKRLIADVPFGAFLSGGIDSGILVALMSRLLGKELNTFSVVFDEKEYSEARFSRIIAKKFKTNHNEIHLTPQKFLDFLPSALNGMDHPSGDGANTYVVSRVTREAGVKMAISGLGGDELFAGYDLFPRLYKLNKYSYLQSIPFSLRKVAGGILRRLNLNMASVKIAEILDEKDWSIETLHPILRMTFNDRIVNEILSDKNSTKKRSRINNLDVRKDAPILSRITIAELQSYMANTLLRDTDQMSMASALEVRVPFLDHDLVNYVLAISDKLKYPHTPKQLLTETFSGILPPEIIHRKKMGFVLPWEHWMRNDLFELCKQQIDFLSAHNAFNAEAIRGVWRNFNHKNPLYNWSRVWLLVTLGYWLQKNNIVIN